MRIDRQRFLLLTASLSGACAAQPTSQPPREHTAVAPPEPTEPDDPPTASVAVGPEEPAVGPVQDAGSPSVAIAPTTEGTSNPAVSLSSDAKCNDMVGKPGKCQFKAPGPQCESFKDLPSECASITKHLKPKIAERAVNCLSQKSGTQAICEFALPSRCASEAIRNGVCPEKGVDKICEPAVAKCSARRSSLSLDECKAGYSAVKATAKKKMLSCISEFCTIEHCLYQL